MKLSFPIRFTFMLILSVLLTLSGCQTSQTAEPASAPPPAEAPTDVPPIEEPTEVPAAEPVVEPTEAPTEVPAEDSMTEEEPAEPPAPQAAEQDVVEIALAGPIAERDAEISGMAWYEDWLILLPQYPNYTTDYAGDGFVFAISKDVIEAYLDGDTTPIEPIQVPFSAPGLASSIAGFEGYEAIAFVDDTVYLTIEAEPGDMVGYLVTGTMDPELGGIVMDTENLTEIAPQTGIGNMSEESLIVAGDTLLTLYEANGAGVNAAPVAHVFGVDLAPAGEIAFPNIEYRITDATALDGYGRFWAINYLFPGDEDLLSDSDPIADMYGEGETHAMYDQVERLVQFQYSADGITMTGAPPIQLSLVDAESARNWEGLVRLGADGFLFATDKWPQTILGFVPAPEAAASETEITTVSLEGNIADRKAEISGMAWYGDYLILMPQYPNYTTDYEGDGFVFAIAKDDIKAFLNGDVDSLTPVEVPFSAPGLQESIEGFEGYEAIAFVGDTVYLTIEAEPGDMVGYLVTGTMAPDLSGMVIDAANLTEIAPQSGVGNMSEESLIVAGDTLLTLYEANGAGVNPNPVAHVFDMGLAATGEIPFPNVEYRVTDVTALDADGKFWGINYFFPGDRDLLPKGDPLAEQHGRGASHDVFAHVERLVQFQYTEDGITLTGTAPIQIVLVEGSARNWEGLVLLDDIGFLIATDKWPSTILAFIPMP
ncbi:MAG: hypothetical protein ACE5GO_00300 [Anaerolineales bacterium]